MMTAFWLPVVDLLFPTVIAKFISVTALCGMVLIYLQTLKFYGLSKVWGGGVATPLIGPLFLGMTWASAFRFWQRKDSRWKCRSIPRYKIAVTEDMRNRA
jgi:hypothetical protein